MLHSRISNTPILPFVDPNAFLSFPSQVALSKSLVPITASHMVGLYFIDAI
jgi:hypothetical protein